MFLTGRPSRIRRDTERWLTKHGLGGHRSKTLHAGWEDRSPQGQATLFAAQENDGRT